MSNGEILDAAFALLRSHFGLLFGIVLILQGPTQAIGIYIEASGGAEEHLLLFVVVMLIGSIAGLVASAATLKAVSDSYLGRSTTVGDAIRFGLGKIGGLMVVGFVRAVLVFLATLALIVPGIIVLCGYAVVSQVVVLERLGSSTDALRRSWDLTRGHRNRALGIGAAVFLIALAPLLAAGMLTALLPAWATALNALAAGLQLVLLPLVACAFTLFYYDLRIRKEAFDLEMLSSQLAAASA